MTDAEKLAEELLPCRGLHSCQYYLDRTQTHDKSCPAYYRPAVAAKLTEKDKRLVLANRSIQAFTSFCVQCGPNVSVDEDGCCATCGCGAIGGEVDKLAVKLCEMGKEIERLNNLRSQDTETMKHLESVNSKLEVRLEHLEGRIGPLTDKREGGMISTYRARIVELEAKLAELDIKKDNLEH